MLRTHQRKLFHPVKEKKEIKKDIDADDISQAPLSPQKGKYKTKAKIATVQKIKDRTKEDHGEVNNRLLNYLTKGRGASVRFIAMDTKMADAIALFESGQAKNLLSDGRHPPDFQFGEYICFHSLCGFLEELQLQENKSTKVDATVRQFTATLLCAEGILKQQAIRSLRQEFFRYAIEYRSMKKKKYEADMVGGLKTRKFPGGTVHDGMFSDWLPATCQLKYLLSSYQKLWTKYGLSGITVLHPELLENPGSIKAAFSSCIMGSEVLQWIQGSVINLSTAITKKFRELGKACCNKSLCTHKAQHAGIQYTPSSAGETLAEAVKNMCSNSGMGSVNRGINAIAEGTEMKDMEAIIVETLNELVQKYNVPVEGGSVEKCAMHMTAMYSSKQQVQELHRDFHVENKVRGRGKNRGKNVSPLLRAFLAFQPADEAGMFLLIANGQGTVIPGEGISGGAASIEKTPDDQRKVALCYIPGGCVLFGRACMLHGGGYQSTLDGNPRFHYYLYPGLNKPMEQTPGNDYKAGWTTSNTSEGLSDKQLDDFFGEVGLLARFGA